MGKSIFTTIEQEAEKFEVTHSGITLDFVLPKWFQELNGIMEDEEKIWEWAKKHEIGLAFCHRAISQMVIDFRAAARPADKKGEVQPMETDSAQKRIYSLEFKPTKRPGVGTKQEIKKKAELETLGITIKAMIMQNMEDSMIKQIMESQFDKKLVSIALNKAHLELGE